MKQENYKLIRARFLLPLSDSLGRDTRIKDGYVLVRGKQIVEVGPYREGVGERVLKQCGKELTVVGSHETVDAAGIPLLNGVLLPGFVKAHGHDHESPLIGVAKDEVLTDWLDHAVNLFTGFLDEKSDELRREFACSPNLVTYRKARLDDVSYGITSALTHHCNFNKYHARELAQANSELGTRLIVAIGSQDRNYDERILDKPDEAVERLDRYSRECDGMERLDIIPGPDQFFSNGPELLKALKKWALDNGTLIHIHSSEEPKTTEWFIETYGMTPVEYGESVGFLDRDTILAHQVNCTDHDLEIIRDRGSSVAHNPLANTILGSGMPPLIRMIEMGIPVAVSTDGSGSADNQNIINAARLATQYQKALHRNATLLPAQKMLELVTVEPAKMLRINAGSLEPGKDADIVLLDLRPPNLTPTRLDNVVENIIWAANGNEIRYVMAAGELLLDDYTFTRVDDAKIKADIQRLSELFIEYAKAAEEIRGTGSRQ
jgi:5-methylthioadenosine/S-adenosylhomocysteine deaminase